MSEIAIEDLMKPRYKVIADYPDSIIPVGNIFEMVDGEFIAYTEEGNKEWFYDETEIYFDKYPHLFKSLEWWEDRKPEEMPEYYKLPGNGKILKTSFRVEKNSGVVMLDFKPTETVPTALMYTLPATETDYLNYINSKP